MRRLVVGACAVLAGFAFALPATAGPTTDTDRQYEGRAEFDPNTFVGFNVVKQRGVRKVAKVVAALGMTCDVEGLLPSRQPVGVRGKLRIKGNRFAGTLKRRIAADDGTRGIPRGVAGVATLSYKLKGRLGKRGKARGTIDSELRIEGGSPPFESVRCYSGEQRWRARRGADLDFEPPPPFRANDSLRSNR